jgi:hypothetical protein
MPQVISWSSEEAAKILRQRFEAAKKMREPLEPQMRRNFQIINNADSRSDNQVSLSFNNLAELSAGEDNSGQATASMNYAFKYLRFLHSQMSANPPSAIVRPATSDSEDHRRADAADRIVRHARDNKEFQELFDQATLKTLTFSIGWIKQIFNPEKGEVSDFSEASGELTMTGDIELYSPDTWDIWVDPNARVMSDVRYIFERKLLSLEEAMFLFPEKADKIKKLIMNNRDGLIASDAAKSEAQIEIFEYYEKAMPVNGMAGRYARFLKDYTLLEPVRKNPHFNAGLPYFGLTYIDVVDHVYGKSMVEYVADLQDMLNRMDSSVIDNIQAHGLIRLLVPDTAEIEDEAISDSTWDYVKYSGNTPPKYIAPPQLMSDIWEFRTQILTAIQELYGINDSMLGIQRREQSAVSQQTAIESGTMIHRRLFKKYAMMVEKVFRDYLGLVKENWSEPRTIRVLGKEKAFESMEFRGSDISSGFDIAVDYGSSLPLDANMRREAIMLQIPLLKEAGWSAKQILNYMKLNELEGMYDRIQMSGDRQREIFEEMIAKVKSGVPIEDAYIPPEEMEQHAARLEFAYDYMESVEFKYLPESIKDLIRLHVKERKKLMEIEQGPAVAPNPDVLPAGMPGTGGAITPGPLEASGIV